MNAFFEPRWSAGAISQRWVDDFLVEMSEPLKRMQVEYLTNSSNKCYQREGTGLSHYERILICKETERLRVFGRLDKLWAAHRDSGRGQLHECLLTATTSDHQLLCLRDYVKRVESDSESMRLLFKKEYARFL